MNRDRLAINSVSTTHADVDAGLTAYAEAGFTAVEFALRQVHPELDAGRSVADLGRALKDRGLRCVGGFETTVACFAAGDERRGNHERIVHNARLLAELGAGILVAGTDGPAAGDTPDDPLGTVAEGLAEVGAAMADTGVTLCVEFNWSPVVKSLRGAVEVARRSGAANVGVLYDTAHYFCTPSKLEDIAASVPWIRHVHVNDMRDKPPEVTNCNSDRVLPGAGCLDLKAIFAALAGYEGWYAIEMFNDELWGQSAEQAARAMYDSLQPYCAA